MVNIKINVVDHQVNDILKAVEGQDFCNLVHRTDVKVYVREPKDKKFYLMDEEQLSFFIDSEAEDFESKIDDLIKLIKSSTTDKFLELTVDTEIESEEVKKVLKGSLNDVEFKNLCTDAVKVRWR